jgi:hypothetical protein
MASFMMQGETVSCKQCRVQVPDNEPREYTMYVVGSPADKLKGIEYDVVARTQNWTEGNTMWWVDVG